jgi:hypothetical protein
MHPWISDEREWEIDAMSGNQPFARRNKMKLNGIGIERHWSFSKSYFASHSFFSLLYLIRTRHYAFATVLNASGIASPFFAHITFFMLATISACPDRQAVPVIWH